MTGTVAYDGRVFEFEYPEPDADAVAQRSAEIQMLNGWTEEDADAAAKKELSDKTKDEYKQKALDSLEANLKTADSARAEVGISQRLSTDVGSINGDNGTITKELHNAGTTDGNSGRDPRYLRDDEVEAQAKDMVSYINHLLYKKHQKRLDSIARNGGSGTGDANFRADVEVPLPTLGPTGKSSGNPLGQVHHELAMRFAGAGTADEQFVQVMTTYDRYNKTFIPNSRELVGYTFITRPHCNFATENLANVPEFTPLTYAPSRSIGLALRGYLDTELYNTKLADALDACPFYDPKSPFLMPAVNSLRSITGFPDINLGIETTEGGFFSESQTSVTGYDRLAKGQELSLTFRDYLGSPILAMHEFWTGYMGRLGDGTMHQYPDDVEANLMGYTVSIYRFIMDPTNRYILHFAKATGCYPKLAPSGVIFNFSEGERIVQSVNALSVQYFCHHVAYNNPLILKDFNTLVERYCGPAIATASGDRILAEGIMNNHVRAYPYISQRQGMNELQWRLLPGDARPTKTVLSDYNYPGKNMDISPVDFRTTRNQNPIAAGESGFPGA